MKEFNNRKIAKQHAEYITGIELRKYLARKVKKYFKDESITVFDGAVGSGQLEQYVNPTMLYGCDIQENAIETAKENYPNSELIVDSFFNYQSDVVCDCTIMNPPFSLKFKELPEEDRKNIQAEFSWKKSGVVDDIFVLKSLKFTKRYGFYILFPGVGYRKTEDRFRKLVGNQLLELNYIENAFEDTSIAVILIVIDKKKIDDKLYRESYNCKTKLQLIEDIVKVEVDRWEFLRYFEPKEKMTQADAMMTEIEARLKCIEHVDKALSTSCLVCSLDPLMPSVKDFVQALKNVIKKYEKMLKI